RCGGRWRGGSLRRRGVTGGLTGHLLRHHLLLDAIEHLGRALLGGQARGGGGAAPRAAAASRAALRATCCAITCCWMLSSTSGVRCSTGRRAIVVRNAMADSSASSNRPSLSSKRVADGSWPVGRVGRIISRSCSDIDAPLVANAFNEKGAVAFSKATRFAGGSWTSSAKGATFIFHGWPAYGAREAASGNSPFNSASRVRYSISALIAFVSSTLPEPRSRSTSAFITASRCAAVRSSGAL